MKKGLFQLNLKISIILFLILTLILNLPATGKSVKYNDLSDNQVIIYGTVKEAVTCIPNPVEDVKVTAVKFGFLGFLFYNYYDFSDEDGEYEIELKPGFYMIFCKKSGYRSIQPWFFYLKKLELGMSYEIDFIIKPTIN